MYFAVCTLQQICWCTEVNLSQEQCAGCHLFWIAICRAAVIVRHASMQQGQCLGTEISSRGNQVLLKTIENPKTLHSNSRNCFEGEGVVFPMMGFCSQWCSQEDYLFFQIGSASFSFSSCVAPLLNFLLFYPDSLPRCEGLFEKREK